MTERPSSSNSFVLRIWWEDGQAEWRGWVQHAGSTHSRYFHHLADLLAFVEEHTGPLEPAATVEPRQDEGILQGGDAEQQMTVER